MVMASRIGLRAASRWGGVVRSPVHGSRLGLRSLPLCTFRKLLGYGRIGTAGRSRSYVVRDEGEARHLARSILKRRASAPRRIGVAYRIRELIDPEGWAGVLAS
jgi:hypothetical protein